MRERNVREFELDSGWLGEGKTGRMSRNTRGRRSTVDRTLTTTNWIINLEINLFTLILFFHNIYSHFFHINQDWWSKAGPWRK